MQQKPERVLAALNDLFFSVKIADAAKRAGLAVDFAKDDAAVLAKAAAGPAVIILDLNCQDVRPLETIRKLKASADTREIRLVGFVSHVQGDLKQSAQEAGCDVVMARSSFSQNLPSILKRYAGNEP